ncbi:MAG: DUF2231 domain-containing protein [Nocardioidaceae bacterium]
MFSEIDGLPVHTLVVHAVVVLAPVSALLALGYLVPAWRRALRWPLLVTAVCAAGSAFVARESGEHLKAALADQLAGNATGELVAEHEQLGKRLFIALVVFAGLAVVVVVLARVDRAALVHTGAVLLAVAAIVVGVLTYQTGEKGARAVWNPTGTVDYSNR